MAPKISMRAFFHTGLENSTEKGRRYCKMIADGVEVNM
jgi:hypothetical protein